MARGLRGGARITGLNETVKALQAAGVAVDDLKDAFQPLAKDGARLASSFAPKGTGRLAKSVRGNRAKNKAVVTAGGARVPYAGAINYGHRKRNIEPSEFMQRADRRLRPDAERRIVAALDALIRKEQLG